MKCLVLGFVKFMCGLRRREKTHRPSVVSVYNNSTEMNVECNSGCNIKYAVYA